MDNCQQWFYLCLSLLISFTLLFMMLLGYNLKLGDRTAKLEKKNGKEQRQIDQLKKEIAELKQKNHA